jgi:ABC-2 type transport system ATP-binding protein
MIEAKGLGKRYGKRAALRDVSFRIDRGEIVGFLGPNGAGKTTTMRILTTYSGPDEGTAEVCGYDVLRRPMDVRHHVGYLPEQPAVLLDHTVDESLRFVGKIRGLTGRRLRARTDEVVAGCGLGEARKRLVGNLSRGYRQRVGLAQALLHDPDVLLLDEPMSGLDPAQAREVRDSIRASSGTRTVLLSTHVLSEVAAVCSSVVVLDRGRLVAREPVDALAARGGIEDAFLRLTSSVEGESGP